MKALLNKYAAIITEYKISAWEIQPSSSRWKARIRFSDGSMLLIKDYLFLRNGKTRKYAYHWQDHQDHLLIRWDNAAHWKSVATFPHHKHVGSETNVLPSREVSLEDVLEYIHSQISQ